MEQGSNIRFPIKRPALSGVFLVAAAVMSLGLAGCEMKTVSASSQDSGKPVASAGVAAPAISPQTATVVNPDGAKSGIRTSTASAPAVENALEKAHQDYLNAYERYVQLLRESGPHAMDTLNALADYQKKYQLFQRMSAAGNATTTGQ